MKIKNIEKIKEFLKNHNNFLISAHTGPEGDCLGAELAFSRVLKSQGKYSEIVNQDKCSREYEFLLKMGNSLNRPKIKNFDAVIILDCSDISRIGSVENFLSEDIPILNIDHHISNNYFGDINLVEKNASSACELLYWLFKELKIKLDRESAICLYTGILSDTGSFKYSNTSPATHLAVSDLLSYNIEPQNIYKNIYENLNFSDLKLINKVLLTLRKDSTSRIAWVAVKSDLIRKYNPQVDLTDNVLNFLRVIRNIEVCVFFKEREKGEEEKNIRINFRSQGKIDVNKVAQYFGGGGHKTASGATLKNISLEDAEKKVIEFIKNILKDKKI